MGKFLCHCGHVISDVVAPCPFAGQLKWETETDEEDNNFVGDVAKFLEARDNGNRDEWIRNHFLPEYPLDIPDASVISDILSRVTKGRCVYRCTECESLYIQKEFFSNEWTHYKKAD